MIYQDIETLLLSHPFPTLPSLGSGSCSQIHYETFSFEPYIKLEFFASFTFAVLLLCCLDFELYFKTDNCIPQIEDIEILLSYTHIKLLHYEILQRNTTFGGLLCVGG